MVQDRRWGSSKTGAIRAVNGALPCADQRREPTVPRTAVGRAERQAGEADTGFRRKPGEAAQPSGVAADRCEGLTGGKKRPQAGSGTAAEVPASM